MVYGGTIVDHNVVDNDSDDDDDDEDDRGGYDLEDGPTATETRSYLGINKME